MSTLRRAAATVISLAALALTAGTVAPAAHAATALPVGAFRIVNYGSGKCAEVVPNASTGSLYENGNRIWQRTCNGAPQQSWLMVREADGTMGGVGPVPRYHVINQYTGLCLDLKDGNTANGAVIQQWTCNGTSNTMLWSPGIIAGRAIFYDDRAITCLDVTGGSAADKAYLQNYQCTSTNTYVNPAQQFYLAQ